MPYQTLNGIEPRQYQKEIYESCKDSNCLVILPTGVGKTLIALMIAIYRQKKYPGTKVLFLAPTRPLASQHLTYFKKYLPELFAQLELFTGKIDAEKRREKWERADIIFSTPQCIANDLKKGLYELKEVSFLIEDECHRCLKNYAYTYLSKIYLEQSKQPCILGLTASPGVEKKTIQQIAENLNIEKIELRTRESKDVKEYLQELNFEIVQLDFPKEFEPIRELLNSILLKKIQELKNRKILFGPSTKKVLLETQSRIMKALSSGNKSFNLMAGASACAIALKIQHALELLETQTLSAMQNYFYQLFEQAEKKQSKAVQHLIKNSEFNKSFIYLNELLARKIENPKIKKLKELVEEELNKNEKSKIIIFSQYRDNASKICKDLNLIEKVKAKVFVGQAKKETKRTGEYTGLNQKEQQEIIQEFSEGKINMIVATSIGEEGLDIPEVNAVIFYEPVPSAIRKIQRAGRTARLMPGKLIILMVKDTRDEAYHWSAFHKEKKMYKSINNIKEDLENKRYLKEESQKKLFQDGIS